MAAPVPQSAGSVSQRATALPQSSFLATRRGKLTLALLAAIAFLDFVDASITNVALPSIRHALHFSEAGLQWVPSAYLLTYGGVLLLRGPAPRPPRRRPALVPGDCLDCGFSPRRGGARKRRVTGGARLAARLGP